MHLNKAVWAAQRWKSLQVAVSQGVENEIQM